MSLLTRKKRNNLIPYACSCFWFKLKDGGNLTTVTNVSIAISDVNERPICDVSTMSETVSVLMDVGGTILTVGCYDIDINPLYATLQYTVNSGWYSKNFSLYFLFST